MLLVYHHVVLQGPSLQDICAGPPQSVRVAATPIRDWEGLYQLLQSLFHFQFIFDCKKVLIISPSSHNQIPPSLQPTSLWCQCCVQMHPPPNFESSKLWNAGGHNEKFFCFDVHKIHANNRTGNEVKAHI